MADVSKKMAEISGKIGELSGVTDIAKTITDMANLIKTAGALGLISILIVGLAFLTFIILNLVGFGYLTAVIFGSTNIEDLSMLQRNLVRMSIIMTWIVLIIFLWKTFQC